MAALSNSSPLAPYRVLDLTEGGFNWCGKVLADLGADVIKIEPPDGSPSRLLGPFIDDVEDFRHSLFWFAYCLNKRSVVLDIESQQDREALSELAATADFFIESFAPGYLSERGLGYTELAALNPGLVYTSITPYGQTGPRAHHRVTDIVGWSMGGMQYLCGEEDRAPVRVMVPQAELHAGAQAAAGSMIALRARNRNGFGQQVDVNMQASVIWAMHNVAPVPKLSGGSLERGGALRRVGNILNRVVFPCKDGFLRPYAYGGWVSGDSMNSLTRWMDEEGAAPEFMKRTDWQAQDMNRLQELPPEADEVREFYGMQEALERFFLKKTKVEILERAVRDKLLIAPCQTPKDLRESRQLEARGFWVDVAYSGLEEPVTHPGPYIKFSDTPVSYRHAAPGLGEHTSEVLEEKREPPALPAAPSKGPPFEGLRVLDMSWVGVGPMTMKYLADHGATVVRVESESRADPSRSVGPYKDGKPGLNRGQFSANFNTGKYGLGLNLKKKESRDLIRRIVREWQPDVIAESFTPGTMAKWGFDYETIRSLCPGIIYFSTTLLGQTGPHRSYGGYGGTAAAISGFHHMTGWPDRVPAEVYGAYTDFINPPNAVSAVIAAIDHRDRTGQGQHLDLAQAECAAHYLAPALLDYTVNGRVQARNGNHDSFAAPHGVYSCKPRDVAPGGSWIAIAVTKEVQWEALRGELGSEAWTDSRFHNRAGRIRYADDLDELITRATRQHDAYPLMERLQNAGVPAGVVQTAEDLWNDPQLEHWGFFQWLKHNECGPMPYNGPQFKLSRTPGSLRWAAPTVGQHNMEVLQNILALTKEDIADLFAVGALETSF